MLLLPHVLSGLGQATQSCPKELGAQVPEAGSVKPRNAALPSEGWFASEESWKLRKAPTDSGALNKTPLEGLCPKAWRVLVTSG